MKKKNWVNAIFIYSIIYTVTTLLNSIIFLARRIYEDPSGNWHEIDRAIIILIGVVAFELCTKLPIKSYLLKYIVAYVPSLAMVLFYVWFRGLRATLAKTAYRDVWLNFTIFFVLFNAIYFFVMKYRNKKMLK